MEFHARSSVILVSDPFESSRRKIARAKNHLAEVKREIVGFLERCRCEPFAEPHPDKPNHFVCKMHLTEKLPEGISEAVGDCVNNLREALDHAMYALAVAAGCPKPRNAYFPFSGSSDDFERNLKGRCADVPKEIYPLLRSFEPYKGGSEALYALNSVCIANKHKLVYAMGGATLSAGLKVSSTGGFVSMPYPAPLWNTDKNEMELATIGPGATLDGHFDFAKYVAFGEIEGVERREAIAVLGHFVDMVETIIGEIEAEARRIGVIQ